MSEDRRDSGSSFRGRGGGSSGAGFSRGGGRGGSRGGGRGGAAGGDRPAMPFNPKLARFQKQNPGSGPHGFGGTYAKGEKGGHRTRAHDDEHIPLAERGLRKGTAAPGSQFPAQRKSASAAAASSTTAAPVKAGTTAIKSKIRDLTRLLKKKDLDPLIKKHKEHELSLVIKALEAQKAANAAAKIDERYKTIKFYERRKITRKLAGIQRSLANLFSRTAGDTMSPEEKALRKEQARWQEDADYIDFFPHGMKYVSLFRNPGDGKKKSEDGSDDEEEEEDEPDMPSSEEEAVEAPADGEGKKASASKPRPSIAELRAAVEAQRASIRALVAKAKAEKLRAERGSQAPVKRRREEAGVKDELFQKDEDDAPMQPAAKGEAAATPAGEERRPNKKQRFEARNAGAGAAAATSSTAAPAAASAAASAASKSSRSKPAAQSDAMDEDDADDDGADALFQTADSDDEAEEPVVKQASKPARQPAATAAQTKQKKRKATVAAEDE